MKSVSAGVGANSPIRDGRADLAVGCFASICRDWLADRLLGLSHRWPQIDIGVHEMSRGALLPALRAGHLALAVLPGNAVPGLRSAEICQGRVMIAMPPGHPLAGRPSVSPADLGSHPVLVSRQQLGGDMHRFLAGRILPEGVALSATILDLGPARMLRAVAAGEGVALVCQSHADALADGVVTRPVDSPGALFPVRAYWPDADPEWPVSALIDSLDIGR